MTMIFLDGDQTLWDFESIMRAAMARTIAALGEWSGRPVAELGTVEEFVADRDTVAVEVAGRVVDLRWIRRWGFERSLRRLGLDRPGWSERITEHYLALRHAESDPYPDVVPALRRLRATYQLGLLTNGNSEPAQYGLAGLLDERLTAVDLGVAKPDPTIYHRASERVGIAADELIMVGDSITNDVVAARRAGWRAVWLDRPDTSRPNPTPDDLAAADGVITTLADLPAVVARLE